MVFKEYSYAGPNIIRQISGKINEIKTMHFGIGTNNWKYLVWSLHTQNDEHVRFGRRNYMQVWNFVACYLVLLLWPWSYVK